MSKLWIFGHSLCLPYNLPNEETGWDQLLAAKLDAELVNLAMPGVDNFYLYYMFMETRQDISPGDIVIVGWSHYSRKLFVLDNKNPKHVSVLDGSLVYHTDRATFIRNHNKVQGDPKKWLVMQPSSKGVEFYDTWYNDYYNELEQKTELQSHLEAVKYTCPGTYVPFYFSQESVEGVDISGYHAGFVTEFIVDNKVSISETDFHFNKSGHALWAAHMHDAILGHNSEN